MRQRHVLEASAVALSAFVAWWAGILYLDGLLAMALPYDQYQLVALLYPDVYYPGLPGWILAQGQPFSIAIWPVAIGWMLVLSVTIGAGAVRYASGRGRSPPNTAAVAVVMLFVAVTVIEAVATLLF